MSVTVSDTTPYAWPWDGAFSPTRAALVVLTVPGAPAPVAVVEELADVLRAAGGAVVQVTTAPPRSAIDAVAEAWRPAQHHETAHGVDGFYGSRLDHLLRTLGRDQLLLAGGWLETSVHSTMRSANDRGYECLLLIDACTAYDPDLRAASRSQIEMSGGIFGAVGGTPAVLAALQTERTPS